MSKEIVLKFNKKTGEVKIEAFGFKGNSCEKATEFLEKALGQVTDFTHKAEWLETNIELNDHLTTDYCG